MGSRLGNLISARREARDMSLRTFAKLVGKSPAFISVLENSDPAPKVSEETLSAIADELSLDVDELLGLARRMPRAAIPESKLDVALYRSVHRLSKSKKKELLKRLEDTT